MTTELQTRISAIKAECEEILRLDGLATAGPWGINKYDDVICDAGIVAETFSAAIPMFPAIVVHTNARFIAHSRNVSHAMARVVLSALECLENQVNEPGWSGHMCDNDGMGCPACDLAEKRLESIAEQWEGK